MDIDVKKIIRPWYFAGFATFLCLLMIILFFLQRVELKREIKETAHYYDAIKEDIIVTERDRMLKTLSMYNLIISTHGNKYHKRYNIGKKRRFQGLNKWQKPLFNRKSYEYEKKLDIPHMTFHTTAKVETAFNPLAENRWEDENEKDKTKWKLKEAGIFQNRKSAVGQALIFLKQLYSINPKLAQELEFKFTKMSDLFDPLNALKVEALLYWGYRRKYANQQAWYVTIIHWGEHRIAPYYFMKKNDGILPQSFSFNKNTIKEDIRDPLQYWGMWYANFGQFSRFRIEVGVEQWYDKLYKKECSRLEWQFIQSWKYVKQLKEGVEDLRDFQLKTKKEHEKKLKRILKKAKEIDKKYAQLHGLIKRNKFKKINDIFKLWKGHFKEIMIDLNKEKKARFNRIALITYLSIIGIWCIFAIWKIIDIIIFIVKKISIRIKNKKRRDTESIKSLMK